MSQDLSAQSAALHDFSNKDVSTSPPSTPDFSALVGSRICHDLISPLGAISNGVELLTMAGGTVPPELQLISESIENANSRIRMFRIAFGAAAADQLIGVQELTSILKALETGGRVTYDVTLDASPSRAEAQCMFLALLCLESAMPSGGVTRVRLHMGDWKVSVKSGRIMYDATIWDLLDRSPNPDEVASSKVQFAMLPRLIAQLQRKLFVIANDDEISLRF